MEAEEEEPAEPFATSGPVDALPPTNGAFITEVVALTNVERQNEGCPALTANALLNQAAQKHTVDMAENDYFEHTGLNGSSPSDRVTATGYQWTAVAENIAVGSSTPQAVVEGWMNSEGHRANILNCDYREIGIGYFYLENDTGNTNYQYYWTQVFASS